MYGHNDNLQVTIVILFNKEHSCVVTASMNHTSGHLALHVMYWRL